MRPKVALYLFTALLLALSCGCSREETGALQRTRFATGFDILERNSARTVIRDAQGKRFTVVHGQGKGVGDSAAFRSPVRRVISLSAPAVPLIDAIDRLDTLVGVKLPEKSWHVQAVKERMKSGAITLVGDGSHEYVNFELVAALKPELIFNNVDYSGKWGAFLEELGIRSVAVHTHMENSLLGQFEWVRMIAEFYGEGQKADRLFNKRVERYEAIRKKGGPPARPSVLWGTVYVNRASVPGGDSFIGRAVRDAGGSYALEKELAGRQGGYLSCDLEMFYKRGLEADLFIISSTKGGGVRRVSDLVSLNPMLKDLKSVKSGNVWCYRPTFWQAVDRPDEVLKDIAAMINPAGYPGYKPVYFEKLDL